MMGYRNAMIQLSEEVRNALNESRPVVALESTIISHGMPYPENVKVAIEVEERIRSCGCIPATVGILNGIPRAGLSTDEIDYIGQKGRDVMKVSRRDFGYVMARGLDGATTVASTMICASIAGIEVFVTGGVGGVHRDVNSSLDVSADLREFSRSPVVVVSAGVKSILDISKTVEYLETEGICVLGYKTDEFPAFYSRKSGVWIPLRIDSAQEAADIFSAQKRIFPVQGMLVANPVPAEEQIPYEDISEYIEKALRECRDSGIKGKEITPFLLGRLVELSGGASLKTNISLVKNNADLGSAISKALQQKREI